MIQDIIAARCKVPKYGINPDKSELIIMTQPATNALTVDWDTTVVYSQGPDGDVKVLYLPESFLICPNTVYFALTDLDGNGNIQVIATEYFVNQRLALYSCGGDFWVNCSNVEAVVIDETVV